MKHIFFVLTGLLSYSVFCQTYTISGYITDPANGENLTGVNILVKGTGKGVITNNYGFYSLSLEQGNYNLIYSYVGYQYVDTSIVLDKNISININLAEESHQLDEVVVEANSNKESFRRLDMGIETISIKKISNLPVLFGENDAFKVIQLLPGIQSASEGSSGFNVRGGNYDQNLILLDEAIVYNPGHIFGFISIFNDDAINSLKLYKGTMPAQYGGRTSSVMDIMMKEGNNKNFSGKGAIGLITSKIMVESPVMQNKGSVLLSCRRSVIDLIARPLMKAGGESTDGDNYYFYDLNAKVNYRFSKKDRLYFSNYYGKDVFTFQTEDERVTFDIPWGNFTSTLRWNHLFNDKVFMNISFIHNSFFRDMVTVQDEFTLTKKSDISDQSIKADITWYSSPGHRIKTGGQVINHVFKTNNDNVIDEKHGGELGIFILDEFDMGKHLRLNIGLRYSQFNFMGPYNQYQYNENNEPVQLISSYDDFETVKKYNSFEPRISVRCLLNNNSSLKAAYTRNSQYVHLISNSGSTLPLDIWVPSTNIVKPQLSNQISVGYFLDFANNSWSFTAEIYSKVMDNMIEFSEEFIPSYTNNSELDYVSGEGKSKGIEVLLRRNTGKMQGWLTYTFSDTDRTFGDLNNGQSFPANTDIRHDFSLVGVYRLNDRWTLGADFVFRSGKPFSIPTSRFYIDGELVDQYTARNNVRLSSYNRLDISATYTPKPKRKKFRSEWIFSIYNVYNRLNTSFVYFDNQGSVSDNNLVTKARSVTILPFMPSVTYKFSF